MRTRIGVMDVTFPTSRTCTGIRTQTQQLLKLLPLPLGYTGMDRIYIYVGLPPHRAPTGDRTLDFPIKSRKLYQLSYRSAPS